MILCKLFKFFEETIIVFILSVLFGILLDYIMPTLNTSKYILELLIECYFHILLIILFVYLIINVIKKIAFIKCHNFDTYNRLHLEIILAVIFYTTQIKLFDKLDYIVKIIIETNK
tara:strand:+ start:173 stop:520 length:348 start_codon:yes stop_codon:yes gene_type:complete